MELRVVVFDRDELRATRVGAAAIAQIAQAPDDFPPFDMRAMASAALLQQYLFEGKIDILLMVLDDAPGITDGVDLLARMLPHNTRVQVIYVDVSGTHATSVYKTPHLYRLDWPIDGDRLAHALLRACENHSRWADHPIVVHAEGADRSVKPSQVLYIESDRRLLRIHLKGEVLETYGKLSEVARKLPASFVQSHKSFLVNLAYVRELRADALVLNDGERVPMSQKRRKTTRDAFRDYVGRVL